MREWERIVGSVLRMPRAVIAALLAAWTAVVLALWTAIFGAIAAVIALILHAIGSDLSYVIFNVNNSGGLTFAAVFAALAAGAVGGFLSAYSGAFIGHEAEVAASVLAGAAIAFVISWVALVMEVRLLRLRGYRAPSQREWEGKIMPALIEVTEAMELNWTKGEGREGGPAIFIADTPVPQAWTHGRSIVLTKGMIDGLQPPELQAVIAHEVMHWRMGDGIAMRMVWAMCWPLAILYNLGMRLSGAHFGPAAVGEEQQAGRAALSRAAPTVVSVIAWLFLWPTAFLIRFVIAPIAASDTRRLEYEADAGVAAAGMSDGLIRALEKLAPFEFGRTAWEAALTRTHPPTEYRIQRLEMLRDAAADIEPPLAPSLPPSPRGLTRAAVRNVLAGAGILLIVALSPLWSGHHTSTSIAAAHSSTVATPGSSERITTEPRSTAGYPDTSAGAVEAASRFATAFYTAIFDRSRYVGVIDASAAPGDTATTLVAAADEHFGQAAAAVAKDTVTNTATVMANRLVRATPAVHPTQATAEAWVSLHYSVNGEAGETWATAPYTLVWSSGSWRISAISPPSEGPTPAQLDGASIPPGFSSYTASGT